MVVLLPPGQQHESTVLEVLMEQGQVKRLGPGRPRLRPGRIADDRRYSFPRSDAICVGTAFGEPSLGGKISLKGARLTESCTVLATSWNA